MTAETARQEWQRGWPVVVSGFFGVVITSLYAGAVSAAITPITADVGWSRTVITAGPMMAAIVQLLLGPVPGLCIARFGPRRVALTAVPLHAAALSLPGAAAGSEMAWYGAWLALGLTTAFVSALLWTVGASRCFDRSRGLAFAVVMSGSGLANAVSPLIAVAVMAHLRWTMVFPALGLFAFVVSWPIAWALFDPDRYRRQQDGTVRELTGMEVREIFASVRFWVIAVVVVLQYSTIGVLYVHMQPIFRDAGMSAGAAASYASLIGIALIVGRLGGGFLIDHIAARFVAAGACALPIVTSVLLMDFHGAPWEATFAAIGLGLALGSEGDIIAYLTSRYFGTKHYGSAYAVYNSLYAVGFTFAPVIGAAWYDHFGNYHAVLQGLIGILLVSAVALLCLGEPPKFEPASDAPGPEPEPEPQAIRAPA